MNLNPWQSILVSAEEMRELDRRTIALGTPGFTLMQRAAQGAVDGLLAMLPKRPWRALVVCGKGNNGGDGFLVAHLLRQHGWSVTVLLVGNSADVKGDALLALQTFRRGRGRVLEVTGSTLRREESVAFSRADILIDALFGTGLNAPVTGLPAAVIACLNSSGRPVYSLDIPSGLDANRGVPLGVAVRAKATFTFGFPKIGQVVHPGYELCGDLRVVDIGIDPRALADVRPRTRQVDADHAFEAAPHRDADAHKGRTGHVAIVAGSIGHTGAALLAAHAACRSGAGLTTLAGPRSLNTIFSLGRPEVMTWPLADSAGFVRFDPESLRALVDGKNAVVTGPGLGTHAGAARTVRFLVENSKAPIVLDADALTIAAKDASLLRRAGVPVVLTPHPGEMARLAGCTVPDVQNDRLGVARQFARAHNVVVVLKGSRTVVAAPDGEVWINPTGNSGMASGGMGDVLAGIVGGFLAQGRGAVDAATAAVYLHGEIADHLARVRGPIGFLAGDIAEGLPSARARLVERMVAAPEEIAPLEAKRRASTKPAPRRKKK